MSLSTVDFVGAALAKHGRSMRGLVTSLREGDPDAFHDARVASRRFRSVLAGYCEPAEELVDRLREYAARLGAVRDLDVARERIALADLAAGLEVREVLDLLAVRREERFADAVDYLDSTQHRALLAAVMQTAAEPRLRDHLDDRALTAAEQALAKATKRLDKAERRSRQSNDAEDRHRTRKAAKRVRYLAEGAAGVSDGQSAEHYRAIAHRAEAVQDHLGLLTDADASLALLTALADDPATPAAQADVLHALADLERRLLAGRD